MFDTVMDLLENKKYAELRHCLMVMNPVDIGALLEEVPPEDLPLIFRILPKELAADTFATLDADTQEVLVSSFSDRELADMMDQMFVDDAVDMIEEMPANVVKRILAHTPSDIRKTINEILKYPKDSAGSIMTIEYVDLKRLMTVKEAFDHIRKTGVDKETIYTCYVTDSDRVLLGMVSVRMLLLADPEESIGDIMETNIIYVNTLEDREEVAKQFDKYDLLALPVVDNEKRLVGIVTVDDAMDVISEEAEEDFQKMAAMSPTETSYLKTSVWNHARHRIVWLLFLMLSSTITSVIIDNYEAAFQAIPLLVSFIPMLMDTGGNCGSQSATLIIRSMALDEVTLKDFFRIVWKELRIALIVGAILAVVNGIRMMLMYGSYPNILMISIVLGLSLITTITISKVLGGILPMAAKALHLDPALMASPLITTIVDACSVSVYFSFAVAILHINM